MMKNKKLYSVALVSMAMILMLTNIAVAQSTTTINWNNPNTIIYGTPLSSTQLNAAATAVINGKVTSVSGTYVYTPPEGTILGSGSNSLNVVFKSADLTSYTNATKSVKIGVAKSTPSIIWMNPADITYGTPVSSAQLNAYASVSISSNTQLDASIKV